MSRILSRVLQSALLTAASLAGSAAAHTEVTKVTPAASASVAAPKQISLDFSEPVNLRFSTFKVYALPNGSDPAALSMAKLKLKNDRAARADTFAGASGLAARVQLPLRPKLRPGSYVIMWSLLSDDGHPVSGQSVFRIR